jgi:hypothetical protein
MSLIFSGTRRTLSGATPAEERAIRQQVVREVSESHLFRSHAWHLVRNSAQRPIYAVGTGLYPDIVALDGSDAGVAWVLEVASPAAIADERSWERWEQIVATGHAFILVVPFGCGRLTERVAETLNVGVGLVYQYGFAPQGVFFCTPQEAVPADA